MVSNDLLIDPLNGPEIETRAFRRGALRFLLSTIVLDAAGIGLLIPITPRLVAELTGEGFAGAAVYGGWLTALFATVQFFAGPILGSLSDRYGRRPVLLVSLTAFGLSYVLMGFARSLPWLFAAQALAGLFGATQSTAGAYIADISAPEHRAKNFGRMGAAFGCGLIVGPVLGGLLAGYGTHVAFFVAAALSLGNVVYGYFALPESLAARNRRAFHLSSAHPLGALLQVRRHPGIPALLLAFLIMQVVMQTLPTTWPYYTMQKFGWTAREVGLSLGVYGLANVTVQTVLTGWIVARFGNSFTARAGFLMLMFGYLGFAFAPGGAVLLACIPITVVGFTTGPALASLMSGFVEGSEQGLLQGLMASVGSVAAIATPPLMSRLFREFGRTDGSIYLPGAPYLAGAALALGGAIVAFRVLATTRVAAPPGAGA
jgi:DHA1 family tetracycline resistance protein-like MFS transporter